MLRLRAMTYLAVQLRMLALRFLINNFSVTTFACLMPGMCDGPCGELGDRIPSIVSILAEGLGHHGRAQNYKGDQRDEHHCSQPKKVFDVPEQGSTFGARIARLHRARRKRNDLRYRESLKRTMIKVTAGSDASHAFTHAQSQTFECANHNACIRTQSQGLAPDAMTPRLCDGDHTIEEFLDLVAFCLVRVESTSSKIWLKRLVF